MMRTVSVTVVVVPRERFSGTQQSLESIYAHTRRPFDLVYVDGGSPPEIQAYLKKASEDHHFTLIRTDYILSPNEARNLGVGKVDTDYVVFIDNDVTVSTGWLAALTKCADETGSWVAGPLYLIGPPGTDVVHMRVVTCGSRKKAAGESSVNGTGTSTGASVKSRARSDARRATRSSFIACLCAVTRSTSLARWTRSS